MVNEIKNFKIILIRKRTSFLLIVVVNRFCVIERCVCNYVFTQFIITKKIARLFYHYQLLVMNL
jgi:hypothetical protein